MQNVDALFRIITLTMTTSLALLVIHHLYKHKLLFASNTYLAQREPIFVALLMRCCVILAGLFGWCYILDWYTEYMLPFTVPTFLRIWGLLQFLLGFLVLRAMFAVLGQNYSMSLVIRSKHELIRHGPYAHVRHPMYTGLFLCFSSYYLIMQTGLCASFALGSLLLIVFWRTPLEEALLQEQFAEYKQYKQATNAYVPKNIFAFIKDCLV